MKKLIGIFFIGALLSVNGLNAQNQQRNKGGQGNAERMEEMSNKAKLELGLDAEQATKWDAVHKDFVKEMTALRDDTSMSSDEKKKEKDALKKQKDEALQAILTKDQMEKFQEMRKENRESRSGGRNGGNKGGNKWGQMKADLNLSEDQSEKWDAILAENKPKIQSIRNDDSLDEDAKRSKMKEMKAEIKKQLMSILDSDQKATFKKEEKEMKQMRKQKKEGNGKSKRID